MCVRLYYVLLQVLYNFLLEFSRFDWDHYCLSLLGPVPLKDLPKSSQGELHNSTTGSATAYGRGTAFMGRTAADGQHSSTMGRTPAHEIEHAAHSVLRPVFVCSVGVAGYGCAKAWAL
jgi:hypothetical protein